MSSVGELSVAVTADTRAFASKLSTGVTDAGNKAAGNLDGPMQSKFGSIAAKAALAMGGAFAAAKIGTFLLDSITKASDLAETANKIQVVFGSATDTVNAFAADSARSLGMSKQQALDAAATFGVFGKSAKLTGTDLSSFSTGLTKLSADLASFYNTTPTEAAGALSAALRGEYEQMRKYGVLLDATSVGQAAMRLGLIKTTKEALTPQQRVLAVQAAIMQQTSDAQGDFGRTSAGLANQQRIMAAELENSKAALGESLMPVMLSAIKAVRPLAQLLFPALAAVLKVLAPILNVVAVALGAVVSFAQSQPAVFWLMVAAIAAYAIAANASAIATLAIGAAAKVAAIGQWLLNAAMSANPIGLIVAAILLLVAGFIYLYKHNETLRRVIAAAWAGIKKAIDVVVQWFRTYIVPAIKVALAAAAAYFRMLWKVVGPVVKAIFFVVKTYMTFMFRVWKWVLTVVLAAVIRYFRMIWTVIGPVVIRIYRIVKTYLTVMFTVWKVIFALIFAVVMWLIRKMLPVWRAAFAVIKAVIRNTVNVVLAVWNRIKAIYTIARAAFSKLVSTIKGAAAAVGRVVKGIVKKITSPFSGVIETMKGIGSQIVGGLWRGIQSMAGSFAANVKNFIKANLPGAVQKLLGISSPSKVFAGFGANIVQGLVVGIGSERSSLNAELSTLLPGTVPGVRFANAMGTFGSTGDVKVYIGDKELTQIVRTEVDSGNKATARRVTAGRRLGGF